MPVFMFGPQDGAQVPDVLWALDVIELQEKHGTNGIKMLHIYEINYEDKNYYYVGQFEPRERE